jgi:hypothetical protein
LEQELRTNASAMITLVSEANALLFTPMLAEVAGSSLEPSHISTPLRSSLHRTEFVRGRVDAIDLENRKVVLASDSATGQLVVPYDHLVLALGSVSNYLGMANAGLVFSGWEYAGGYLPLLGGLPDFQSQTVALILHFLVALLIGSIFGILFQRDVRGYGSSMGWGLGFGIFLWFFGPLTVFPMASGQPLDWSAEEGTALFGSLVGYMIYGFILGTVYAFLDRVWVRLFIQSDPLNREPEGVGVHFLRSIEWGGLAGLVGGLVSLPVMNATGILPMIAGPRYQLRRHSRPDYAPSGKRRNRDELWLLIPR